MPIYSKEEELPYTTLQLFDLVSNIEEYPDFIPWCKEVNFLEKNDNIILANLLISYHGLQGSYTSKVYLHEENKEISVELAQGPFQHLYQSWKFTDIGNKMTLVEFDIDFKLRSFILDKLVSVVFPEMCKNIMYAFKDRAKKLYT